MNQSSFDPGRPKSRPYDYDSATGQSKPAPNPEFEKIFRRAKQHQQQMMPFLKLILRMRGQKQIQTQLMSQSYFIRRQNQIPVMNSFRGEN